jgi:transposase
VDVHKHSRRVERLEIIETGRRRRWSEDEKLKIVVESFQSPRQVAATARRHGISRWQLHEWRRSFRAAQTETERPSPAGFAPVTLAAPLQAAAPALAAASDPGTIEIDFANGAHVRVTGAIDEATLAAALRALEFTSRLSRSSSE